jgi:hypothetical protein
VQEDVVMPWLFNALAETAQQSLWEVVDASYRDASKRLAQNLVRAERLRRTSSRQLTLWPPDIEELLFEIAEVAETRGDDATADAPADRLSRTTEEPRWIARNKLLAALLLVVLTVLSEPAYAELLPPEIHRFLAEEQGPAAFCMAFVAAVTAAMAVNNSKNKKD